MRYLTIILLFTVMAFAGSKKPAANTTPDNATADNPAVETASPDVDSSYRLRLYNTHTDESLDIVYRRGEEYLPDAIEELNYFLRDSRTGAVAHFDPRLFDLLNELTASLGHPNGEIDVVCGYRTPETNRMLRRRSRRVAKHSLHMQAMAIDIRVPGVTTKELRNAALDLHQGGVGYYRKKAFVHVDVGPVRKW